jgi:hypothetical protein
MRYPDDIPMREARARFFADNAAVFGPDGGYDRKWVRLEMGPLPIYIPNTKGRKRAVGMHDLHHIATEYDATTMRGEAEIAAWEVAAGCGSMMFAWIINLWGLAIGLLIAPRRTFRAFVRGRCSDTLYHAPLLEERDHDRPVGEFRARLKLNQPAQRIRARDVAAFIGWSVVAMLSCALPIAPFALFFGVVIGIYWLVM